MASPASTAQVLSSASKSGQTWSMLLDSNGSHPVLYVFNSQSTNPHGYLGYFDNDGSWNVGGAKYGPNGISGSAGLNITGASSFTGNATNAIPLIVNGVNGQTVDLLEVYTSNTGSKVFWVDNVGGAHTGSTLVVGGTLSTQAVNMGGSLTIGGSGSTFTDAIYLGNNSPTSGATKFTRIVTGGGTTSSGVSGDLLSIGDGGINWMVSIDHSGNLGAVGQINAATFAIQGNNSSNALVFAGGNLHNDGSNLYLDAASSILLRPNGGNSSQGVSITASGVTVNNALTATGLLTATGAKINVVGSGGAAQTLQLYDTTNGASSPSKYLRVNAGSFQICNSAFSNVPWSMSDAGDVSQTGSLSIQSANLYMNNAPTPGAPTLSQTAGGTAASGTFFAKVTWNTSFGETSASAEASFTVSANNQLVVTPPATPGNAPSITSWNVYVSSTTGTETKQASNLTLGAAWTMPTTGLVAGAALPIADSSSGALRFGNGTFLNPTTFNKLAGGTGTWVFTFANAGSLNSANPFWNGYHFATADVLTHAGSNTFPRASVFNSYSQVADPTDLYFNIQTGNSGGIPYGIMFTPATGGSIYLNGSTVAAGSITASTGANLAIGGQGTGSAVNVNYNTGATAGLYIYDGGTTNRINLSYASGLTAGSSTYGPTSFSVNGNGTVLGTLSVKGASAGSTAGTFDGVTLTAGGTNSLLINARPSGNNNISFNYNNSATGGIQVFDGGTTNNVSIQMSTSGYAYFYANGHGFLHTDASNTYLTSVGASASVYFGDTGNSTAYGRIDGGGYATGSSSYGPTSATVNGKIFTLGADPGIASGDAIFGRNATGSLGGSIYLGGSTNWGAIAYNIGHANAFDFNAPIYSAGSMTATSFASSNGLFTTSGGGTGLLRLASSGTGGVQITNSAQGTQNALFPDAGGLTLNGALSTGSSTYGPTGATINGTTNVYGYVNLMASGTATSGTTSYSSQVLQLQTSYWNGSAAATAVGLLQLGGGTSYQQLFIAAPGGVVFQAQQGTNTAIIDQNKNLTVYGGVYSSSFNAQSGAAYLNAASGGNAVYINSGNSATGGLIVRDGGSTNQISLVPGAASGIAFNGVNALYQNSSYLYVYTPSNGGIILHANGTTSQDIATFANNGNLSIVGAFSAGGSIVASGIVKAQTQLIMNDSKTQILLCSDGTSTSYIESGNAAWTAAADLHITGYNGNQGSSASINFATINLQGAAAVTGALSAASASFTTPLSVSSGGTGTSSPGLIAGTGISITGSWPNQTISATGGGGGASLSTANTWTASQTFQANNNYSAVSAATSGTTDVLSPTLTFNGNYWTGSASATVGTQIYNDPNSGSTSGLVLTGTGANNANGGSFMMVNIKGLRPAMNLWATGTGGQGWGLISGDAGGFTAGNLVIFDYKNSNQFNFTNAGNFLLSGGITLNGATAAPQGSFSCGNWYRSDGTTGWYNSTYGGGIYMTDTTWVRTYNSKGLWTDGQLNVQGTVTFNGGSTWGYVGPGGGTATGSLQLGRDSAISVAGVAGTLIGFAVQSVAWYTAIDKSGNMGVAGSYYAGSLSTLKRDIAPVQHSALDILRETAIVHFRYKTDPHDHALRTGFIAEHTHPVLSGPKQEQFDFMAVDAMTIKAVQELEAMLADERAYRKTLESRIAALETYLNLRQEA